jgi:hypothetical protein
VSISTNGYVFLGENSNMPYDILVGLNYDLDTSRPGSGQIYYKSLTSNSFDFKSFKTYLNLFDPYFEPTNIFMITYDNVLPYIQQRVI